VILDGMYFQLRFLRESQPESVLFTICSQVISLPKTLNKVVNEGHSSGDLYTFRD